MTKQAYRLTVLDTYHAELKRTRHIQRLATGPFNAIKYVPNAKRRKVFKARLRKLRRYMSIAWAGYAYGKVVKHG